MVRIAYLTAGTNGAGHIARGVALQRALQRTGEAHAFALFSPPSPFSHIAGDAFRSITLDPSELRDPERALTASAGAAVRAFAPDVVVLDLFWVPFVFVPLGAPVWLLLRSVPPVWLIGPREAGFDVRRYERVLAIEPAPGLEPYEPLSPIVACNPEDAVPRPQLCERLGVPVDQPLHLVLRSGLPSDADSLPLAARALDPMATWHTLDLTTPETPFPSGAWLAGLTTGDRVVAAPGYNTFWEARRMGWAGRTHWVPLRRQIDDMAWRATLDSTLVFASNGADELAAALLRG